RGIAVSADQRSAHDVLATRRRDRPGRRPVSQSEVRPHARADCARGSARALRGRDRPRDRDHHAFAGAARHDDAQGSRQLSRELDRAGVPAVPRLLGVRAQLIGQHAGAAPLPGDLAAPRGRDATAESAGTSHFVIVDAQGNVVSMTTTIESIFGSGRTVEGFVLNNQLTDFSFVPAEGGRPVANAVRGGKRPRSSMAPVIVLDHAGNFVAALGSPGGSAILEYNAKALVGLFAWRLSLKEAIELPNL